MSQHFFRRIFFSSFLEDRQLEILILMHSVRIFMHYIIIILLLTFSSMFFGAFYRIFRRIGLGEFSGILLELFSDYCLELDIYRSTVFKIHL